MIDSQSVKTTEGGGVCSDDAGKQIAGRKRHIITDTLGCMLFIIVHSAAIQDHDGSVYARSHGELGVNFSTMKSTKARVRADSSFADG